MHFLVIIRWLRATVFSLTCHLLWKGSVLHKQVHHPSILCVILLSKYYNSYDVMFVMGDNFLEQFWNSISFESVNICCAPSSELPSLKTGLPHLPTKPWSEVGVPVLRPGCPIFWPKVLPQLLTKLEDGADPTSDLPQLPTIKYHLELFFSLEKI